MADVEGAVDERRRENDPIYSYEVGVPVGELFDWSLLGAVVRNKRRRMGYKSAQTFSRTIYNRTRMVIKPETITKIEGGRQSLSAMQFMAICMTLEWSPDPGELFRLCACQEWQDVAAGHVPWAWCLENQHVYALELGCGQNGPDIMRALDDSDDFERIEVFEPRSDVSRTN